MMKKARSPSSLNEIISRINIPKIEKDNQIEFLKILNAKNNNPILRQKEQKPTIFQKIQFKRNSVIDRFLKEKIDPELQASSSKYNIKLQSTFQSQNKFLSKYKSMQKLNQKGSYLLINPLKKYFNQTNSRFCLMGPKSTKSILRPLRCSVGSFLYSPSNSPVIPSIIIKKVKNEISTEFLIPKI